MGFEETLSHIMSKTNNYSNIGFRVLGFILSGELYSHVWVGQSLLPVPLFPALSPGFLLYWPAPTENTLPVHTHTILY